MPHTDALANADLFKALIKSRSIEAASDWSNHTLYPPTSHNVTAVGAEGGEFSGFTHTTVKRKHRIGSAVLVKKNDHVAEPGKPGGYGCLRLSVTLGAAPGSQPIYFLPWDKSGGATELTIPDLPTTTPLATHPCVFVTTAVTGCSLIFKGTQQNPTILHCGREQGLARDAHDFWPDFVTYLETHSTARGRRTGGQLAHASKRAYIKEPGVMSGGKGTTQDALDFQARITDRYDTLAGTRGRRIAVQDVCPWGAVVGIRRGSDWTFYLQENANVVYFTENQVTTIKKRFLIGDRVTRRWERELQLHYVSRPMILRQIFPGGSGYVRMCRHTRTLL